MKIRLLAVVVLVTGTLFGVTRTERLRQVIASADRDYVFVAMHRGDWRNFPENSKGAILSAIRLGADIVELDVQRTKDGRYILNHDRSLDRTTTGKGFVRDYTLAEIRKMKMRGLDGKPTDYDILTLEEALELTRGKIIVNIDKFGQNPLEILKLVDRVGAMKEVLVKAGMSIADAKKKFGPYWKKVESGELLYMPILSPRNNPKKKENAMLKEYVTAKPRVAMMYELCFDDPKDVPDAIGKIPLDARVWVNTLWDSISAAHSDRAALLDPEGNWGWWLDRGATMIQSDYVAELIVWLTQKGRRNLK